MNETLDNGLKIRRACLDDASAIAAFHVRVWRETYGDIAPAEAVKVLDVERRLRSWKNSLQDNNGTQTTLVAIDHKGLVGLINFGATKQVEFQDLAEIKHLYVDERGRGHGLGKRLITTAFHDLSEQGYEGVGLAVVQENLAARKFYKAIGGIETTTFTDPGPMWKSTNILIAWSLRDIAAYMSARS